MVEGLKDGDNVHVSPRIVACDIPAFGDSNFGFRSGIWRKGPS